MKRLTEFDVTALEDPSFSRAVIDWQQQHVHHQLPVIQPRHHRIARGVERAHAAAVSGIRRDLFSVR